MTDFSVIIMNHRNSSNSEPDLAVHPILILTDMIYWKGPSITSVVFLTKPYNLHLIVGKHRQIPTERPTKCLISSLQKCQGHKETKANKVFKRLERCHRLEKDVWQLNVTWYPGLDFGLEKLSYWKKWRILIRSVDYLILCQY